MMKLRTFVSQVSSKDRQAWEGTSMHPCRPASHSSECTVMCWSNFDGVSWPKLSLNVAF